MEMTDARQAEQDLVIRLINSDEEAFCELYSIYKNRLIYFAMKFIKSREFAEDIFHDAFTVVWQSRKFINPEASFSSFLYTIVRNRVLNILRDLENEQSLKDAVLKNAVDYTNDTKESVLANDLMSLLSKALEKLTPRQREIFDMSRNRQMSHKEIADSLGISINTVQEHISASLKVIRGYLSKYSDAYVDMLLLLICFNI
ncbi:RNA polymerase sigma-70 factor [Bacteroides sedimenti]|uniref:DNA-directed RNA polymerase sigma-70 factor n=1 Tax=Bacteroides sedimenti TaxID=2136147 RepID=A0ABN6Z3Q7_9BACE